MAIKLRKTLYLTLAISLLFQQMGFTQITAELNISGYLSGMGSSMAVEKFRPLHLRYLEFDPSNEGFKLLVDKGDTKDLADPAIVESTKDLMKYFFVGLTLPDDSFWVNLRPDSEEQIIDSYLEKTDVGKIMLEADLQLKKDTAAMTSPTTPEGKEYWDKLYKKAEEFYGFDNVTIPTLTRPWIVPGEIIVRESKDSAYIYKATLKVMLEQDYLKDSTTYTFKDERSRALNEYSSELIRELIIPKLTREVNSAKRYAGLRQVYYSLILSRWFKLRFTGKAGSYTSLIDTRDLTGLISEKPWSKTDYFKQYQKSFVQGEYNIKGPVYTPTGQVIRSYFSGGLALTRGMLPGSGANDSAGMFINPSVPTLPKSPTTVMVEGHLVLQADSTQEVSETATDSSGAAENNPEGNKVIARRELLKATGKGGVVLALGVGVSTLLQGCFGLSEPLNLASIATSEEEARQFKVPHFGGTLKLAGKVIARELPDGHSYRLTYTGDKIRRYSTSEEGMAVTRIDSEYYQDASSAENLVLSGEFDDSISKIGIVLICDDFKKDGSYVTRYSDIVTTGDIKSHQISVPLSKFNFSKSSLQKVRGIVLYMGDRIITGVNFLYVFPIPVALFPNTKDIILGNPTGSSFTLIDIEFRAASGPASSLLNESSVQDNTARALPVGPAIAATSRLGATPEKTGGINFKALLMAVQPVGSFASLDFELPQLTDAELAQINIDSELQQIESLVKSGIPPSDKRITELVAACAQKKELGARADNLLLCLIDICKLQEENASESSAELKEALVIVDTSAS